MVYFFADGNLYLQHCLHEAYNWHFFENYIIKITWIVGHKKYTFAQAKLGCMKEKEKCILTNLILATQFLHGEKCKEVKGKLHSLSKQHRQNKLYFT